MWNTPSSQVPDTKEYNSMNQTEKVAYFSDWIVRWHYFLWWVNIKISDLREVEPNIEELFPLIEKKIREYSPESWINYYVDFDDTPDQTNRTDNIEWIEFNNSELSKKIGDLFYNGLSNFLRHLSENINWWQYELIKVSELLKKASDNIEEAWGICEPHVRTNFKEMKHTDTIKWSDISNENLAKWIWNLYLEQLWDFLSKLSQKLEKDWEADKNRPSIWKDWIISKTKTRTNLANELFESSKAIKEASEIITSLSNRKSSYTWEEIKEQKEWFLSRIWKLVW